MNYKKSLGTALLTISVLLGAPHAYAHSKLIEASPASGAALATAPSQLELRFSAPIYLTHLAITADGGEPRVLETPRRQSSTAYSLALPALAPNHYTVEWRSMSLDGHVMKGALDFTVNAN